MDGRLIQQLNPLLVPSKRRNPLLADFFSWLGLMERRGSGMKKIFIPIRDLRDYIIFMHLNSSQMHRNFM